MSDAVLVEQEFEIRIEASEGDEFARLSGDFNPLHVDPSSSRVALFSEPIPHGVFVLLRALEGATADRGAFVLRRMKCRFSGPVHYGQPATCRVRRRTDGQLDLFVEQRRVVLLRATVDIESAQHAPLPVATELHAFPTECRRRTIDEVATVAGSLPLPTPLKAASLLPALAQRISATQLAEVCAWTRLIGMECPGYHSVFTAIDVAAAADAATHDELRFAVGHTNAAMQFVALDIVGPTLRGRLESVVR
jgi:acyl dehydratase